MKVSVVVLCLAVLVATVSGQRWVRPRPRPRPVGGARGHAAAESHQGQTRGFGGLSQIQYSSAKAGGTAFGGGASLNGASSKVGQSIGRGGAHQFANNQAFNQAFGR